MNNVFSSLKQLQGGGGGGGGGVQKPPQSNHFVCFETLFFIKL
jgi:hypothetical protein